MKKRDVEKKLVLQEKLSKTRGEKKLGKVMKERKCEKVKHNSELSPPHLKIPLLPEKIYTKPNTTTKYIQLILSKQTSFNIWSARHFSREGGG